MYFNEWANYYLGKATDYDGYAGPQCVDVVKTLKIRFWESNLNLVVTHGNTMLIILIRHF